jgi:hypothetical protein
MSIERLLCSALNARGVGTEKGQLTERDRAPVFSTPQS